MSQSHKSRPINFKKMPRTSRQNPPRKQRNIQDLLLPSTVNDSRSAMNHSSKANFRIIRWDYTSSHQHLAQLNRTNGFDSARQHSAEIGLANC